MQSIKIVFIKLKKNENRIPRYHFFMQSRQSTGGNDEHIVCVETGDDRCALRLNDSAFCLDYFATLFLLKS